ncbi:MBL fold metallo-hydrolase [Alteribacter keqinensis]|uniref:MBL fold metallo-hydrolase n=1 Tax=Alteribacter keqinensis TaxID=2483800 RepID=A0A3M7TQN7_9BACI|nr:MBL fold metallo-hydrolase [Alteribacter keqinensis]RNA67009.1 MBL fold metallo-hydrolase [Alteribacter keqinensis]
MSFIEDNWFTVTQLDHATFGISEYGHWEKVHSYLLLGKDKAALIDTGLGIDNMKKITDQLTSLPVMVLTTHVHWDHIGSHGEYGDIFVHEQEEDWLVNGIKGLPIDQIRKDVARDITLPVPASFNPEMYTPYQGKPAGTLKDGDTINLGDRELTIYHTPGHSPGHIAVFDVKNGFLFSGDLIYDETPVYAFFPSTSPEDLIRSLERMTNLNGVKRIYGGHNSLGLDPDILEDVRGLVSYLKEHNLIEFGTGVHRFNRISVQF